jgi:ATP-binding cassette subfamily B protein
MTPPAIGTGRRARLIAILTLIAVSQALAAAVAAFATRWLFMAMDRGAELPFAALLALIGSALFIAVVRVLFRRLGERLGQDYACDVRLALFQHASRMAPADLAARRVGYVTLRFVGDLTALKDWPARGLPLLVEGIVMAPAMVAILYVLDPVFGAVGLALAVLSVSCLVAGAAGLMQAHRRMRARRALMAADLAERLPIAPHLAAYGRRSLELALIRHRSRQLGEAAESRVTQGEAMRALPDALSGIAAAAIIWWGATNGLPTGTIAAGLAVLSLTARPLRDLMGVVDRAGAFHAAHAKLVSALARPLAKTAPSGPDLATVRLSTGPVWLDLRSVAVHNGPAISLRLDAGEQANLPATTDVEGVFGAISGLEAPSTGQIRLNDVPVQDLTPGSLRRNVFRIDCHPVLLKGSMRRALTLGLSERPDDAEIISRLDKAGLLDMLDRAGGLGKRLTEGARILTDMQRIEISILQAALRKPGLLLVSHRRLLCAEAVRWLQNHTATVVYAE